MTIPKAHITWTATALGASFSYYSVERYNELLYTNGLSTPGWQRIAKITTEATATYDDYEGRYTVEEQYRVQVYDTLGGPSVPVSSSNLTKTVPAGQAFIVVANENTTINQTIGVRYPFAANLPERAEVTAIAGRYGQRLSRSSDRLGETPSVTLAITGTSGPALWRTLVTNLRSNLSYVCLLDPWGTRWFAGMSPSQVTMPFHNLADLALTLVEVTDTPAVVTV